MKGRPRADRRSEAGFSLATLLAGVTIMMILMTVALPSWKYVVKNEKEQELYFRGDQIASAIERYQKKNGNAAPVSLEMLVKGKYLRKEYKDPMAEDGKWRLIRPGETLRPPRLRGPGFRQRDEDAPRAGRRGSAEMGPFIGVASFSEEASLRIMNGAESYDQWLFVAGKPRVLGKAVVPSPPPQPGARPGQAPSPGAAPQTR
jgi:type II secretory pathway pseudopilin PulG